MKWTTNLAEETGGNGLVKGRHTGGRPPCEALRPLDGQPMDDIPHICTIRSTTPQARTTSAVPVAVSDPCPKGLEIVAEGIDPL